MIPKELYLIRFLRNTVVEVVITEVVDEQLITNVRPVHCKEDSYHPISSYYINTSTPNLISWTFKDGSVVINHDAHSVEVIKKYPLENHSPPPISKCCK